MADFADSKIHAWTADDADEHPKRWVWVLRQLRSTAGLSPQADGSMPGARRTDITPPAAVPTSRDRMGLGLCNICGPRGGVMLYIYESGAVWPRFFQTLWLGLKGQHEWSFAGLRVGLVLVRP
jgi:hypothetical protein